MLTQKALLAVSSGADSSPHLSFSLGYVAYKRQVKGKVARLMIELISGLSHSDFYSMLVKPTCSILVIS